MVTPAALYYPHTAIGDKNIIKNSLLLWDQVEYITPTASWRHKRFESRAYNEAIDLIAFPHFPTYSERAEVHDRVASLVDKGLPPWFFLDAPVNVHNAKTYPMYTDKLDPKTWRLLEDSRLVRYSKNDSDFHASPYFGLIIMSLLADACAGELKRKITDRADAYAWLQKCSTAETGGEFVTGDQSATVSSAVDRLVTISINLLNTDNISIASLVAMRKREAKGSSHDYRAFRLKYLSKVDEYVDQIAKAGRKEADTKELERQFQLEMKNELRDLKNELRVGNLKTMLSKAVGVAITATAGAFSTALPDLNDLPGWVKGIGIGALGQTSLDHFSGRRKILKSNAMSWLYLNEKKASRFNPKKIII